MIAALIAAASALDGQAIATFFPASMVVETISGDSQAVAVSSAVPAPVIVRVSDMRSGAGLAEVTVRFPVTYCDTWRAYGPCVSTTDVAVRQTNADGLVQAPRYTAGTTYGDMRVYFQVERAGVDYQDSFSLSLYQPGNGVPFKLEIVSGGAQDIQVGERSPEPLVVRVLDGDGRAVPGTPVSFRACPEPPPIDPPPSPWPCAFPEDFKNVLTDANGIASRWYRANLDVGTIGVSAHLYVPPAYNRYVGATFNIVAPPRQARATAGAGGGEIALRVESDASKCVLRSFDPLVSPESVSPRVAFPHGTARVSLRNCGSGKTVKLTLFHPGGMPEGARVWLDSPSWHPIDVPVGSAPVQFTIRDGGDGDADRTANGDIDAIVGIGYGDPDAPNFQDLWWAGPAENGWGVSIVQHGEHLVPTIFAYDPAGRATWFAMPSGAWNTSRDVFNGKLYSPRGKPLGSHSSADLVVGPSVGAASLTFIDAMNAVLEIDVGGHVTRKVLNRQLFGPMSAGMPQRYGDMWWAGPSQSGWGLVLQQQYSTLFGVLFTYREDGSPAWVAMPSGFWSATETFEGRAYSSTNPTWMKAYDAAQLANTDVGAFKVRFGSTTAEFEYLLEGRRGHVTLERLPY
jgi:hypothetical protein